ncbi:dynein heavy chain 10, axonemal-like protein [Corchorus olitorius]|uniref:Dynein heavy chain 10, axonemal-like protein n=1 Tax=Corchorus olitorius TaxID=93759 RepID=A0A1R3JB29_9ROSI|nr:dynein heavy chain 10, axonemal-like protein [Corchorus olitorius]
MGMIQMISSITITGNGQSSADPELEVFDVPIEEEAPFNTVAASVMETIAANIEDPEITPSTSKPRGKAKKAKSSTQQGKNKGKTVSSQAGASQGRPIRFRKPSIKAQSSVTMVSKTSKRKGKDDVSGTQTSVSKKKKND